MRNSHTGNPLMINLTFLQCIYYYSLIYIAENMDPLNSFPPLFEAKLELNSPDLIFIPSLESGVEGNFRELINGIIEDVMFITTLILRIYSNNGQKDYKVSLIILLPKD